MADADLVETLAMLRLSGVRLTMHRDQLHVVPGTMGLMASVYDYLREHEREVRALLLEDEWARAHGLEPGRLRATRWSVRQGRVRDY